MRKLPKGLLVKMVRIRLENEVIVIMMMMIVVVVVRGSPSWAVQHNRIVRVRLNKKERMMLVVVGGLL